MENFKRKYEVIQDTIYFAEANYYREQTNDPISLLSLYPWENDEAAYEPVVADMSVFLISYGIYV